MKNSIVLTEHMLKYLCDVTNGSLVFFISTMLSVTSRGCRSVYHPAVGDVRKLVVNKKPYFSLPTVKGEKPTI
ncbi:unnamed protein product [Clavelina lepadiformis]|uniref:Uncharacterized protein n=1 Tax=Clavelina lepadiformis TaxID=159417 RepID=A0ABP0GWG3_CLALP